MTILAQNPQKTSSTPAARSLGGSNQSSGSNQAMMTEVTAALREIGHSPAAAVHACRRHYDIVRWFQGEATPGEIANIIDQHERGGLEAEDK